MLPEPELMLLDEPHTGLMRERGLCVDHTTIYRWVQRSAPEIDTRCRPFLRRTHDCQRSH